VSAGARQGPDETRDAQRRAAYSSPQLVFVTPGWESALPCNSRFLASLGMFPTPALLGKKVKTMVPVWNGLLTEMDELVIVKGGYGRARGLGGKPLLLIIDVQYNYVGSDQPILEQLQEWPSGGGSEAWKAVRNISAVKQAAKACKVPVIYSRNVQKHTLAFDGFGAKTVRDQTKYLEGSLGVQIISELKPDPDDLVIDKSYASVFYGTPLQSWLVKLGIDTLIIVGGTTSGCCRATAVDAVTRCYNVAMVEECLFDRISVSHKVALLDLWMKYCDVVSRAEIQKYLINIA
jgi:nicotinamidase-related amidase